MTVHYHPHDAGFPHPVECCGNQAWRGRLCPYHQGRRDGIEQLLDMLGIDPAGWTNGAAEHLIVHGTPPDVVCAQCGHDKAWHQRHRPRHVYKPIPRTEADPA